MPRAVFVVAVLLVTAGCNPAQRVGHGGGGDAKRYPIEKIAEMYRDNAAKAAAFYRDRDIVFEMRVDRIDTSYGDRLIVIQEGDDHLRYGAIFDGRMAEKLAEYKKGSILMGRGRLSHTVGGITLDDCTLDD